MREPARPGSVSEDERRRAVRILLERSAEPDGFVPFDRFMEVALYGSDVGFYTRP